MAGGRTDSIVTREVRLKRYHENPVPSRSGTDTAYLSNYFPRMASSYDILAKKIESGQDVSVDAEQFTVEQLMMLARAAYAHDVTLSVANGPYTMEDAMAVRRAGRGHVVYARRAA